MSTVPTEHVVLEGQGAFIRVRRPSYWLFAGCLAFGLISLGSTIGNEYDGVAGALWMSVAVNGVLAAVFIWIIGKLDLFEKEPPTVRAAAMCWGALPAVAFSIVTNNAALQVMASSEGVEWARRWGPAIAGPLNEEWYKALGIVLLVLIVREHFHRPIDGLIYGAMVGIGFQVVENITYAVNFALVNPNNEWAGSIAVTVTRLAVAGPWSHPLYTAVAGLGISYCVTQSRKPWTSRVTAVVVGFATAVCMHALWNMPLSENINPGWAILLTYGKGFIILAFFIVLYLAAARIEFSWFVTTMSDQDTDVITTGELTAMRSLRARRKARKAVAKKYGKDTAQLLRQLQNEQVSLGESLGREYRRSADNDPDVAPDVAAAKRNIAAIRSRMNERTSAEEEGTPSLLGAVGR
ncbi:PrsW family intramembrane metalloprotease [Haloglycomyces albus]|uniref:PrsW family intramembrane metalloprotease n=1 Tax=Haloglycomyces albus TaxID=526067 RepID=UPI00046CC2CE|nr:PrsW family intramembrane metalloprotease [Haloglycomyces albus]